MLLQSGLSGQTAEVSIIIEEQDGTRMGKGDGSHRLCGRGIRRGRSSEG